MENLSFFDELSETRKSVLVNMAFNLGVAGLMKFKNMLKAVSEKRWEDASSEMLNSRWADQVGNRAIELSEMMAND
jgi:lysozyme